MLATYCDREDYLCLSLRTLLWRGKVEVPTAAAANIQS